MEDITTRQVQVEVMGDEGDMIMVNIDEPIAPLIRLLNEKQFFTEYCCHGHMEDAFMGFYVKFYPMNTTSELIMRIFIDSISDLYVEDFYEFSTKSSISSNYVQLTDPTPEEIEMARKIVFRDKWNNETLVNDWSSHCIIVRPTFMDTYKGNSESDWDEFVETNRDKITKVIKRLIDLLNTLED